jgi:hypothetical protein
MGGLCRSLGQPHGTETVCSAITVTLRKIMFWIPLLTRSPSALYAHKFHTGILHNVTNPEEFGFASRYTFAVVFGFFYHCANARWIEGQVQPFWLTTADSEKLFCWHVIPLDVYLENEQELFTAAVSGDVAEELKGTVGEKLLSSDPESRVVVNFHGVGSVFVEISRFLLQHACLLLLGLFGLSGFPTLSSLCSKSSCSASRISLLLSYHFISHQHL